MAKNEKQNGKKEKTKKTVTKHHLTTMQQVESIAHKLVREAGGSQFSSSIFRSPTAKSPEYVEITYNMDGKLKEDILFFDECLKATDPVEHITAALRLEL